MPYYFLDYSYIVFVLPALLIAGLAQLYVKTSFSRYSRQYNHRGYTGYQVARDILDRNGLYHVRIERVPGSLTDHFDPRAGVVRLSDTVYQSGSVAAIGVAAHEVGHAIQHAQGYFPIKLRSAILPVTQIGSTLAWPLAIFGVVLGMESLAMLGVWLFMAVVLFQLITLPVEFNASRRALKTIREESFLDGNEYTGAKRMLTAAALTYVAALIVAVGNLLRLLSIVNRNSDDRR